MQLTISNTIGDKLARIAPSIRKNFWIGVQEDFEKNLIENIKPHSKTGTMERNATVALTADGVEGYIDDRGMMVSWRGKKVNYATFVHFGSAAHPITPTKKKSLRFAIGGGFAFAKKVEHPGYEGDEFLYDAAKQTLKNIERIWDKEVKI